MAKRLEGYAERLYTQALTDPSVNSLMWDEMEAYLRAEANALHLDEDAVIAYVEEQYPEPDTVGFRTASKLAGAQTLTVER